MTQFLSATGVAAMVGIVGSGWIAGGNMALSNLAIPGLLSVPASPSASAPLPATLAAQWHYIYEHGRATMPATMLTTLLAFSYLAYERGAHGGEWRGFATAGVLAAAIVPFTLVVMNPTNHVLITAATATATSTGKDHHGASASDEDVRAALVRWQRLNLVRAGWSLAAAVVGFWTFFKE